MLKIGNVLGKYSSSSAYKVTKNTDAFPNLSHSLCNPCHGLSDFSHGLVNL